MLHEVTDSGPGATGGFVVPGTCFAHRVRGGRHAESLRKTRPRDPALRGLYLTAALADVPRLLEAVDRNPYRPTYGCLDRQYWHYRTSSFPSQMVQEGVLPLALIYATAFPGNRWHGNSRVRQLAIAALRFAARSSHRDGSCDDYYPFERALGAAVFSLRAAADAYELLGLDDRELLAWLQRRCRWLIDHDESGRLANHQALAALGLLRVGQITGSREYHDAAEARIRRLLAWQSDEGWFEEYGGADPGYQTLTIDCLAEYRRLRGDARLDEPLRRAVAFARHFLHPDGSYAGEYGSRGTYHFYPAGMELLAAESAEAADLADGFLRALATGKHASFADDRMFLHRLGNLIQAYVHWSPCRPAADEPADEPPPEAIRYFPKAQLLVRRSGTTQTIVSAARGGVFKHFGRQADVVTDAGLIVETTDGRVAVSQMHDRGRAVAMNLGATEETASRLATTDDAAVGDCEAKSLSRNPSPPAPLPACGERGERFGTDSERPKSATLSVSGPLHWARFETATPIKQAVFHLGMATVGRWCRTLVRRLLQRRLITGRRASPVRLTRRIEFLPERQATGGPGLRVTDTIELTDRSIRVRRMSYGTDHQTAYVAACGVYQDSVLQPWTELGRYVDELNARRSVNIVREL